MCILFCCPNLLPFFFLPLAVRGTRLDFGGFLQRSSTSAPRMGHVRVRDGFYPFPPFPGRVPLWHGDSDRCQLEFPGKGFLSLFQGNVGSITLSFCPQMPDLCSVCCRWWERKGQAAPSTLPSLRDPFADRAERSFCCSFMS